MQTYTLSSIQSMLGLSRAVITGLIDAGFVTPTRGKRREYRFSFQDMVLLRTAHALQTANIAPRRIVRSLQRLQASLPDELPLSGLRIAAVGNDVAVRDGARQWSAESGQLLIDFEVKPVSGSVAFLAPPDGAAADAPASGADDDALTWFNRGVGLEATNPARAEQAYAEAIRRAPAYVDPALNLGVLLGNSGRAAQAVQVYEHAIAHAPNEALLHFNLGVALEDLNQPARALDAYATSLRLDPTLADAHFNTARLHEQLGHAAKAIRHYSEYRRLQR
jgi:tetratricopeptide (TPR) repeat protein